MKTQELPQRPARFAIGLLLLIPLPLLAATQLFVAIDPPGFDKLPRQSSQVAWGDYDNDGLPDAYVVQFPTGQDSRRTTNVLFRNVGNGSFVQLSDSAIGGPAAHRHQSWRVEWADVNNDGRLDLVLHEHSINRRSRTAHLYLNQPDGRFTIADAGEFSWPTRGSIGNSISLADYDQDGWLDILLCGGADLGLNALAHSRGDGSFTRVTGNPITSEVPQGGMNTALWTDIDGDGDPDLVVAHFWSPPPNFLYRNDGAGQFTRLAGDLIGPVLGISNVEAADFDRDGHLDLVTAGEALQILLNRGDGEFRLSQRFDFLWSDVYVGDYDNDGDTDILSAGVGIERLEVRLFRNDGTGRFTEVSEAFTGPTEASGNWVDFDNDGFLDLFLAYPGSPQLRHVLYKNQGNGNHWIKFRLVGSASNRSAFGARVRVKATLGGETVWQLLQQSHSLASGDALRLHFGLADATVAEEVRIEWPSGNVQVLENLPADRIHTVTEPAPFRPERPVVTVNGTVTITNLASALSRQWHFNGQPLEGQTNWLLTLTQVQPAQTGRYTLVRETSTGTVTQHVFLRVNPQFTKILQGEIVTEEFGSQTANWFDIDNDGWLDVHIGNSSVAPRNSLFRNNRDGTFTALTDSPLVTHGPGIFSATPADYDNDGWVDMFLPHWDHFDLFRNTGEGIFSPMSLPPLTGPTSSAVNASWSDYNRDGHLDLFVTRGWYTDDIDYNDRLFRSNRDGTFTQVEAAEVGELVNDRLRTTYSAWFDYDNDGDQDILVIHYGGVPPRLHRNNGDGTFTRVQAGSLGAALNDEAPAIGDYDNDGWPDVFLSRWLSGVVGLHRNLGHGMFANVTHAAGMSFQDRTDNPPATWVDYDNDGHLDLLLPYAGDARLYRNRGDGTFQSVNIGNMQTDATHWGLAAWADYDNNGFPDLLLVHGDSFPVRNHLYRNEGNANHWLKVKAVGVTSNRDAIGAKIRLTATIGGRTFTQLREISGNAPGCGAPLPYGHFGLGDATRATKVRIEWPSGVVQELADVGVDQMLTVTEAEVIQVTCIQTVEGSRILCRGLPATAYTLQESSDLSTWRDMPQVATTDDTGTATVVVPNAGSVRFYRAIKR
ncbi:MAG: VCBS repeat-containing protein [Verrucomicrobiae bacterium]|nr:VCBS repeat-containing protein [Verrucomicrobiae bacterium]